MSPREQATVKEEPNRLHRPFWAVNKFSVVQVEGFDCHGGATPDPGNYWWVPELGCSMEFGTHLFDTEKQALKKAIDLAESERDDAACRLDKLWIRLERVQ
jgi:hypothetical protein